MAASKKRGKVSEIDVFNKNEQLRTVEQYFDALEKGFQEVNAWRKKQEEQVANAQKQAMIDATKQYIQMEAKLRNTSMKNQEKAMIAYRKKLLADYEKKRREDELKVMNEVAKEQYNVQTKYDKQRRESEKLAREQANKETIEFYKEFRKQGGKLNAEQLADEARAKSEVGETKIAKAISKLAKNVDKLDGSITKYSQYSAGINARLQGLSSISGQNKFSAIESSLTLAVGVNPYFKTETMLDNLQALVEAGIASNIEQRAFLQTAKDDIATTFDVANGALLRIIRLQQSDSTAARLGMEAYLTRFLNELVQNTEYLTQTFDSVQEALIEASSFMSSQASTEFEYVVQKWLGALTGVGLSESSAVNIAQALGALGSGNIEALSGTNLQNLLVMAASRTNYSYADLLSGGLTAQSADALMRALVEYMIEIGSSSSNVVRSQFAQTFGLTYSDLMAAQQLSSSLGTISGNLLSYQGMYSELGSQLNALPQRINMAQMIDTLWENIEFGLASNVAKNPALAAIWKVTGLIQENTGGINIPGTMFFDLNTTVENLVRLGVVGLSSLGMIGDLVSGLSSTFAPSSILTKLGISSGSTAISRGTGLGARAAGISTSASVTTRSVATSSGEDISSSALTSATESGKESVKGQEEGSLMDDIKKYLVEQFHDKFIEMLGYVHELRDKVIDGEIEVSNYSSTLATNPLIGESILF